MKETMLNNRLHINDVVSVIFLILLRPALFDPRCLGLIG